MASRTAVSGISTLSRGVTTPVGSTGCTWPFVVIQMLMLGEIYAPAKSSLHYIKYGAFIATCPCMASGNLGQMAHSLPATGADYRPLLDLVGNSSLVLLGE